MRQKCMLDTSFLYKLFVEKKVEILDAIEKYEIYTAPNVMEELCYKIIMETIAKKKNTTKFYELKSLFEHGVCEDEIKELFRSINVVKENIVILELNEEIFDLAKEISIKYKLLPNDALIAAACKYYGIRKIATFDEDFARVDFLEIVKV